MEKLLTTQMLRTFAYISCGCRARRPRQEAIPAGRVTGMPLSGESHAFPKIPTQWSKKVDRWASKAAWIRSHVKTSEPTLPRNTLPSLQTISPHSEPRAKLDTCAGLCTRNDFRMRHSSEPRGTGVDVAMLEKTKGQCPHVQDSCVQWHVHPPFTSAAARKANRALQRRLQTRDQKDP